MSPPYKLWWNFNGGDIIVESDHPKYPIVRKCDTVEEAQLIMQNIIEGRTSYKAAFKPYVCPVCDSMGCNTGGKDHTRKGDCLVAPKTKER
jgi:hypothetical protein